MSRSPNYTSSTYVDSETGLVSASGSGLAIHGLLTRSIKDLLESGPHHNQNYHRLTRSLKRIFATRWYLNLLLELDSFKLLGERETSKKFGNCTLLHKMYCLFPSVHLKAWSHIEDSMIIALAHTGCWSCAPNDQGMTLSADVYGVLIQHVKDTTLLREPWRSSGRH